MTAGPVPVAGSAHPAGQAPGLGPGQLTVIVPTMNERANIARFLAAVPAGLDMVLVDPGCDGTAELAVEHRPQATTVIRARADIPQARQIGSEAAATPWLLFTDADVVFSPTYFDRLAAVPVARSAAGLVGVKGTVDGYDRYHRWFIRGQAVLSGLGVPAATGSNMLVRRDVLHAVGGFDPQLSVNEDTEMMFRVRRHGHQIVFRPDLSVLAFDHRRLDAGLPRKVAHGALRNTALYLGVFGPQVRRSDWGYWSTIGAAPQPASTLLASPEPPGRECSPGGAGAVIDR